MIAPWQRTPDDKDMLLFYFVLSNLIEFIFYAPRRRPPAAFRATRTCYCIVFYFILFYFTMDLFLFFLILLPDEGPRRSAGRHEHDLI